MTAARPGSPTPESRPEILCGRTIQVRSPFGTIFVTLNENGDGVPFELFLNVGKCGSDIAADAEAMGRLCSLLLRLPSPVPAEHRVEWIVRNLAGIGGSRDVHLGEKRIRSLADAVSFALNTYLEEKRTALVPGAEPHPQRLYNETQNS